MSSIPSIPQRTDIPKLAQDPCPSNPTEAIPFILNFWFRELDPVWWFMPPAELDLDTAITNKFTKIVEKAITTTELDEAFVSSPAGTLAFLLLCDQFPRNIYRPGTHAQPGLSWSGDAKALRITTDAIAKGWDRQVQEEFSSEEGSGYYQRYFFYLPLEHAEDLITQIAAVSKIRELTMELKLKKAEDETKGERESEDTEKLRMWAEASVPFAEKHLTCIREMGRFPKRNEPLGRENRHGEKEWLEKHPMGF